MKSAFPVKIYMYMYMFMYIAYETNLYNVRRKSTCISLCGVQYSVIMADFLMPEARQPIIHVHVAMSTVLTC